MCLYSSRHSNSYHDNKRIPATSENRSRLLISRSCIPDTLAFAAFTTIQCGFLNQENIIIFQYHHQAELVDKNCLFSTFKLNSHFTYFSTYPLPCQLLHCESFRFFSNPYFNTFAICMSHISSHTSTPHFHYRRLITKYIVHPPSNFAAFLSICLFVLNVLATSSEVRF